MDMGRGVVERTRGSFQCGGMLYPSFSKFRMVHCTKIHMNHPALALLVPVLAQAATIIIDGDTIDVDGVRIRIVQIDTCIKLQPLAKRAIGI